MLLISFYHLNLPLPLLRLSYENYCEESLKQLQSHSLLQTNKTTIIISLIPVAFINLVIFGSLNASYFLINYFQQSLSHFFCYSLPIEFICLNMLSFCGYWLKQVKDEKKAYLYNDVRFIQFRFFNESHFCLCEWL